MAGLSFVIFGSALIAGTRRRVVPTTPTANPGADYSLIGW
jgi:hypothetical protein